MAQDLNITKNPSAEVLGNWSLEDYKEGTVQFLRLGNLAESNNRATPKNIKVLLFMII